MKHGRSSTAATTSPGEDSVKALKFFSVLRVPLESLFGFWSRSDQIGVAALHGALPSPLLPAGALSFPHRTLYVLSFCLHESVCRGVDFFFPLFSFSFFSICSLQCYLIAKMLFGVGKKSRASPPENLFFSSFLFILELGTLRERPFSINSFIIL